MSQPSVGPSETSPQLGSKFLFKVSLELDYSGVQSIGAIPAGGRTVVPVSGGRFEGPRLHGQVLPGADWVLWRPDEAMLIDVRLALRTDDGATIAMVYTGLAYGRTEGAMTQFRNREAVLDTDIYIRTTPRFETSDPRYDWLNRVVAVGHGYRGAEESGYRVYEIL
ncbi:DUF3237 domain-containing protein [Deinococcus altitudinis]|uniref:DUF3237 domain-containing protein n=1 Tax=Deinococcus altitudinis TaxID=468914 RepID=UPI003891A4C1